MTETRTTRLELPSYSADSPDGLSREDWQDLVTHLEGRTAYDDGTPVGAALPTTGLHAARYFWQVQQPGGGANPTYRTLWRSDGATLYSVGGPTITTTQLYRGLHSSVSGSVGNDAVRIEHELNPDDGGWGGNITYAGAAYLRTGLALGDDDDTTVGRLAVGAPALPGSGVRMSVDSYASGEHAVVARVRHATGGSLFRGLNTGGSQVFNVDGIGRLSTASPSSFGGASPSATASLAVAPTSGVNGITQGLMLYGLTDVGHADDDDKALVRGYPDLADTVPILAVNRLNMQLGRITWGTPGTANSGTLRFDANAATFRTYGGATGASRVYYAWHRASAASPDDTAQDTLLANMTTNRFHSALPMVIGNQAKTSSTTLTVQRVTDFSAAFMDLYRIVPDGLGGSLLLLGGVWDSDGRLRTGAWWKGDGTIRDARQTLHHRSRKAWAVLGDNETAGQAVAVGGNFTYTFPVMTVLSVGAADLIIRLSVELLLGKSSNTVTQGQVYGFECSVSINGGTFNVIDQYEENASVAPPSNAERNAGDRPVPQFIQLGLNGGDEFQVRIKTNNGIHPSTLYLREFILDVEECLIETYVTA